MINKMLLTTERVVDSPTARGPSPVCRPAQAAHGSDDAAEDNALGKPFRQIAEMQAGLHLMQHHAQGKSQPQQHRNSAEQTRRTSRNIVRTGVNRMPATTRCTTRNCTGDRPIVCRALNSSFTFMVPNSAAKAEPGAARQHDRRHDRPQLPRHDQAQQVRHEHLRAEFAPAAAPTRRR